MPNTSRPVKFRLTVSGFRRVVNATLEAGPGVTVVLGQNAQGKTSLMHAVAAALSRTPRLHGATKEDGSPVLHDPARIGGAGAPAERGTAIIEALDESDTVIGVSRATWPDQATSGKGVEPWASVYAVGLASPFDGKDQWLRFLEHVLPASRPTQAVIHFAIASCDVADDEAAKVAVALAEERIDFAQAEKDFGDKSRAEQQLWKRATHRSAWGEKLARDWRPEGWDPMLEGITVEDFAVTVDIAKRRVAEASARSVADAASEIMVAHAKALRDLDEERSRANREHVTPRQNALAEKKAELAALGTAPQQGACAPCPECEALLEVNVDGGRFFFAKADPAGGAAAHRAHQEARAAAEQAVAEAQRLLDEATINRPWTQREMELEAEVERLTARAKSLGQQEETAAVALAKATLGKLERQAEMIRQVAQAEQHDGAVRAYKAAAELMAPTGLRRQLLVEQVEATLNPWLADRAPILFDGLDVVVIDTAHEDLALTAYGETYEQIAWGGDPNSVALRMRHLCQLMAAAHDGSELVLLDRADTYVADILCSLCAIADEVGVPAIVAMTRSDPSAVADNIARGTGASAVYVISDGRIGIGDGDG